MNSLRIQADKEMKEIYNLHFPEALADDTRVLRYSKREVLQRYSKAFKFWNEQRNKALEVPHILNIYKWEICEEAIRQLKVRIMVVLKM